MLQFVVIAGPDSNIVNQKLQIHDGDTLGSSSSNSICLPCDSILPQHLKISIIGKQVQLIALDPKAEIWVNSENLSKAFLSHADFIKIGDYELMFEEEAEAEEKKQEAIDENVKSRIESRVKYYETVKHVLDSFKGEERSQKRLVTLYKISNIISGILDLDQLLKSLLEIILEELSADRAIILLFDNAKGKFVPAAALSTRGELINPRISATILQEVCSTKESLLCENIMDDARFKAQESVISHNIMSAMCIPLIRKGEVLGVIQVDSKKRGKFSKNDLELLTQVAMQAAIVIENARFYKARQHFNQNLLSLSEATQCISSYLRSDLIVQDTARYAALIFQTSKTYLFLKENNKLRLVASTGTENEMQNLPVPQSIIEVAEKNTLLLISRQEQIPVDLEAWMNNKISLVAVPIAINNLASQKTMGVLCILNKPNSDPYSIEDQELLKILARYTAIALSNALFYEELKQKEQEIAQWNQELEKRVVERTEQLEAVQGKLIQTEKMAAVGLLASGVSHEFNNIIASMYGFAQIAARNEKYREKLVGIVIEQSKRACEITEGLLSFSKQKGDTAEIADVHRILDSVLNLISTALENEGIELIKEYGDIPKTMMASAKIQQVFMNIIINARHAIEKNGIIKIKTALTEDQQYIRVSIQDNGTGIKEANLSKIFEPFYTTKGSFGGGTLPGTGIGLSLCYNIVKQHDGEITVTSKWGEGSCFTVVLPVTQELPKNMQLKEYSKETQPSATKKYTGKRILVVEDTDSIREMLVHILKEREIDVRDVSNGSDAVELCKKQVFDYIFLDIRMPGEKDGFVVFDEIKRLEPETKIILITGRAEDATLMKYVGCANGYLRKPFDIEDIDIVLSSDAKNQRKKTTI